MPESQLFLVKKKKKWDISFSYAKILEETKFQPLEFPQNGSIAINVEREREKSDYNGQCILPEPKLC